MGPLFLTLSICLSTGRGVLSKEVSINTDNSKSFFFYESLLFLMGLIVIPFFDFRLFNHISLETIIYGLIYGLLLIGSQCLYTLALKIGKTSICSMIYSFGFIIPTLCGFIFWEEKVTILKIIGICLVFPLFYLISLSKKDNKKASLTYLIPLILSAICSGGLGVLQKIQARSDVSNEKTIFLFIGFALAFIFSFITFLLIKKNNKFYITKKTVSFTLGAGLCFGLANMINTILASLISANILFPTQNIGVIVLSTIAGFILFKEKPKINEFIGFILGVCSILLLVL